MEFYCYETHEMIRAKHRPLVFITSNNEKELPDAFLRRCFSTTSSSPMPTPCARSWPCTSPSCRASCWRRDEGLLRGAQSARPQEKAFDQRTDRLAQAAGRRGDPASALQSEEGKVSVPPLVGALLKNEQDMSLFEKLVFMNQRNR
jgi:hypothetical protein